MGKPSSSCLKIIACGSDSTVEDDIEAPEAKGSGEKRGWSFRKKSARHQVLSSCITSGNLTLGDKEIPQSTNIQSQTPVESAVPEKAMALEQPDVKLQPPAPVELKPPKSIEPELSETLDACKLPMSVQPEVSETVPAPKPTGLVEQKVSETVDASESPNLVESKTYETVGASKSLDLVEPEVSVSVAIESKIYEEVIPPESTNSIEMKLPETVVASQDNNLEEPIIIVIQTGVRGFLAQRELEKLRSIVKLQAVVHGHLVRRRAVDTLYCMQGIIKVQSLVRARHSKGGEVSVAKHITSQSSTEKLLRNGFARQLLQSTPKSKSTVIKCDPLNPDSAWTWLERWMAVSSSALADLEKPEIGTVNGQSPTEKVSSGENLLNPEFAVKEASKTFEKEKSSINCNPAEESQTSNLRPSKEKMEQSYDRNDTSCGEPLGGATLKNQSIESDSHLKKKSGFLSNNLDVETGEPKFSMKRMASDEVNVESKKFAYGSRKSSNHAFIAAQSKFKELSSTANYNRALSSRHQEANASLDTFSSSEESVLKEKEPSSIEVLIPDETRVKSGGSECGTELSVTSALDSPDQSEAEVDEVGLEVKYMEERASNPISSETLEININGRSSNSLSSALAEEFHESNSVSQAIASDERENGECVDLDMVADSPQVGQKPGKSVSDVQVEVGSLTEQPAYKFSSEASPNNGHRTIEEPQGTPSSEVSVKAKRSKVDKSASSARRSSLSAGKKTATKQLHDSGVSSVEQLPKDQKTGKRRNSFDLTKSDDIDEEPRDSTSSIKALPSYMQATESARAKAHSPRSSPDAQDKDGYIIKKRHSLPGAGERQGSPRVPRSTSQAPHLQPGKGNTNSPPQERRWLR